MSRPLKFRAWDKKYKQGISLRHIKIRLDGKLDLPPHCDEENVIIEQYTGLKDKNGKEIYEGDIVKAKIDGAWETSSNTIGFGKATWSLRCYWDEKRYAFMWHIIGSKNCPDRVYDFYDYHISDIEVIGNIHENPELLGDEE